MPLPTPQALLQLPYLDSLYGYSLKLLRYADTTTLASLVRADWIFYSSHPALFLSTYLAHGLLVDYFEKKRRCGSRSQEDSSTNLEWLASLWDWYASYLLHPITSFQQVPSDLSDWEDDPSFLFERLAFPDLWLRPLVNMDYMKALPTWRLSVDTPSPPAGPCRDGSKGPPPLGHHDYSVSTGLAPHSGCHKEGASSSSSVNRKPEDAEDGGGGVSGRELCDCSEWPPSVLPCSECVVCLENFEGGELLMGLPCGHAFHQHCIVVWLAAGRHCCPVCRWPSYKKKSAVTPPLD